MDTTLTITKDKDRIVPQLFRKRRSGVYLDLLNGMDYEGVLKILHGPLHPVIERSSSFGIFQIKLVNCLQQFFCSLGNPHREKEKKKLGKNIGFFYNLLFVSCNDPSSTAIVVSPFLS